MSEKITETEQTVELSEEMESVLNEMVEELFSKYMSDYELDPEGSINDLLYEFFAEGFYLGLDVNFESQEEEDSGDTPEES